jgi:zinc D-Ala-D-Ala carboxypeptidase
VERGTSGFWGDAVLPLPLLLALGVGGFFALLWRSETAPSVDLDMNLSRNFTLRELVRSTTATVLELLARRTLQPLRDAIGAPLTVSSGYRSPELNAAVGGAAKSQHMKGQAADVTAAGLSSLELLQVVQAAGIPYDQAITYDDLPHLHLSYTETPRRQVLRRVAGSYQEID